jgi:hypothetical protein
VTCFSHIDVNHLPQFPAPCFDSGKDDEFWIRWFSIKALGASDAGKTVLFWDLGSVVEIEEAMFSLSLESSEICH